MRWQYNPETNGFNLIDDAGQTIGSVWPVKVSRTARRWDWSTRNVSPPANGSDVSEDQAKQALRKILTRELD